MTTDFRDQVRACAGAPRSRGPALRDPRVVALLDESIAVVRRRNQQHPTGAREAFDRMTLMRSRPFAHAESVELRDLLGMPARGRPQLSLH